MLTPSSTSISDLRCPSCNSGALYRYGKGRSGRQRFLCMICKRQFTYGASREVVKARPACQVCGKPMHLYKRERTVTRFRCSGYPRCRQFTKITKEV